TSSAHSGSGAPKSHLATFRGDGTHAGVVTNWQQLAGAELGGLLASIEASAKGILSACLPQLFFQLADPGLGLCARLGLVLRLGFSLRTPLGLFAGSGYRSGVVGQAFPRGGFVEPRPAIRDAQHQADPQIQASLRIRQQRLPILLTTLIA